MKATPAINTGRIKQDWNDRGYSFGIWTDPPGQVWKDFVHATEELFMLTEGEIELEMKDKTLRPQNGEVVIVPANTFQTVRNVGNGMAKWLYGYKRNPA